MLVSQRQPSARRGQERGQVVVHCLQSARCSYSMSAKQREEEPGLLAGATGGTALTRAGAVPSAQSATAPGWESAKTEEKAVFQTCSSVSIGALVRDPGERLPLAIPGCCAPGRQHP